LDDAIQKWGLDLGDIEMIPLLPYQEYLDTVYHSKFIISDSGTGQEEPALLNTRVVVPRDFTERPQSYANNCSFKLSLNQDFDQIFEEQTVIPSLDPAVNTQTIISSSIYSIQEKLFWFGTLIASKNPEGCKERFKIINPNKIPCTIKFTVKPRTQSKSEGFAFDVSPDGLTIDPHKHKYVTVGFYPTAMMQYSGIFEGIVEHGNDETKQGKLTFELRGEGTLPTL
jgi:hypothetical protein